MIQLVQSPVVFNEEEHTYFLGDKQLLGVTSTLIRRAFPGKYDGIDPEVLAAAAQKGKELHAAIEFQDHFGGEPTDVRVASYIALKEKMGLTTLANEYTVSDEERYASQIDIVLVNAKDEICLVDTKTTYNLDRASVALQLSIYKRFFERQNPGLCVSHLYALWLPNKDNTIAEMPELSPVDDDTLDELFLADLNDEEFTYSQMTEEYEQLELQYRHWSEVLEEAEANIKAVKEQVMMMMSDKNLTQIKSGFYTVSYIPAKTSKRFDSAAFKKEHADLYKSYMKDSESAAQVRFLPTNRK